MPWRLKPRIRRPRPGYERLHELITQELVRARHRDGDLIPVAEFRALLCRASRRLLTERSVSDQRT